MNRTNRGWNRTVLFLIGIILLAVGAAAVTVMVWPTAADYWTGAGETGRGWFENAITATTIEQTTVSWIGIAVVAVLALLILLLILTLTRVGRGRARAVVTANRQDNPAGRIVVRDGFISDAVKHSLADRDEILFSHVSASAIRDQSVLHVSVTPRQNTSPRHVADDLDRLIDNLASLTGQDTPAYISIHSGLRAKLAGDQRRVA